MAKKLLILLIIFSLIYFGCSIKDRLPLSPEGPGGGGGLEPSKLTTITVTGPTLVTTNRTAQYTAIGKDQYGATMSITPTWMVTGGIGTINQNGLLTAASSSASGQVIAYVSTVTGKLSVTITTQSVSIYKYGILTEDSQVISNLKLNVLNPDDPDGGAMFFWETPSLWGGGALSTGADSIYEGGEGMFFIWGAYGNTGYTGFYFQFGNATTTANYYGWNQNGPAGIGEPVEKDMSFYDGGVLHFAIKTENVTNDVAIGMEGPKNTAYTFRLNGDLGVPLNDGQWHVVEIPLNNFKAQGIDLTRIVHPFQFFVRRNDASDWGKTGTVRIDDIKWIKQ